jgi:hypothetical protein
MMEMEQGSLEGDITNQSSRLRRFAYGILNHCGGVFDLP